MSMHWRWWSVCGIPRDLSNATGDKLVTDGRMAVLEF